jgi:cell volume regulation protein A
VGDRASARSRRGRSLRLRLPGSQRTQTPNLLVVLREFLTEMAVGTLAGLGGAYVVVRVLRKIRLENEALYPALALVLAVLLYSATAFAHGSGFLAVFIAGLALGDARAPYKREIERFHSSLASLAELTVFVALGLTVTVATPNGRIWLEGVVLFLTLGLVARPFAIAVFLAPFRLRLGERAFIAGSGLKGAVPILLAAFAVLDHVDSAGRVYGIVFVVVLLSVVGQGSFVPFVATTFRVPCVETQRSPGKCRCEWKNSHTRRASSSSSPNPAPKAPSSASYR